MPDSGSWSPPLSRLATGALALRLADLARDAGARGLIHIACSASRAELLVAALRGLVPDLAVLSMPPWDCLPYDRVSPSRAVMGRRMHALRWLTCERSEPRLVITTADAALQRVPPPSALAGASCRLACGAALDVDALRVQLHRFGYVLDDRVDEPGEAAIRGEVIDIFPAEADYPVRIDHRDGRITGLRDYDAESQRSHGERDDITLAPASEASLAADAERAPGIEHGLPRLYDRLSTLFDYLPKADIVLEPGIEDRLEARREQIIDAYEGRCAFQLAGTHSHPMRPEALYLDQAEWWAALDKRRVARIAPGLPPECPRFSTAPDPASAARQFLRTRHAAGDRILLAAPAERTLRRLERLAPGPVQRIADWRARPDRGVCAIIAALDSGFRHEGTTVLADTDLFEREPSGGSQMAALPTDPALHLGDAIIHWDHGLGLLDGLETVEAEGIAQDCLRLRYADGATLLVPVE